MVTQCSAESKSGDTAYRRPRLIASGRPRAAGDDHAAQPELLPAAANLTQHIAELKLALDQFEKRGIAGCTHRQLSEIAAPKGRGRDRKSVV